MPTPGKGYLLASERLLPSIEEGTSTAETVYRRNLALDQYRVREDCQAVHR